MNIDLIHKISEILASIAIVASLIFVGVQVGQNTSTMRQNASTSSMEQWTNLSVEIATNEELLRTQSIVALNGGTFDDLTQEEEARIFFWASANIKTMEIGYLRWKDGLLDERLWEGQSHGIRQVFSNPVMIELWRRGLRNLFSSDFQAYADEIISQAAANRP